MFLYILQCVCDNDFVNFRRIMSMWIDGKRPDLDEFELSTIEDLPFSRRYFYMACAAKRFRTPNKEMFAAVCPETDDDRQESTLWLHDVLRAMYRKVLQTVLKQGFSDLYAIFSADIPL